MKAAFLSSLFVLAFSALASASTLQMGLGQTAQLVAGDVAVISSGNQTSVVICNGSAPVPTQPAYQNFEGRAVADLMLFPKANQDEQAKNWCLTIDPDYTADLKPAVKRALDQATNQCQLAGFRSCVQIGQPEKRYLGLAQGPNGVNQCAFRVFVRGSN